eukprot:2676159-Rhodomonas_salina.1
MTTLGPKLDDVAFSVFGGALPGSSAPEQNTCENAVFWTRETRNDCAEHTCLLWPIWVNLLTPGLMKAAHHPTDRTRSLRTAAELRISPPLTRVNVSKAVSQNNEWCTLYTVRTVRPTSFQQGGSDEIALVEGRRDRKREGDVFGPLAGEDYTNQSQHV